MIYNGLEGMGCVAELSVKLLFEYDKGMLETFAKQSNCTITVLRNDDIVSKALLLRQLLSGPGLNPHNPDHLKLILCLEQFNDPVLESLLPEQGEKSGLQQCMSLPTRL